jgi:NADPH-dependent glutamate synthase beta subunit-like oxidoreductase
VSLPDEYNQGLNLRKATYKRYAQAIPGAFAIQKTDKAPCRLACPAGLNVQGYVQMVGEGKYKEALQIIMEDLPLPGVLGRICPHGCEDACRRCDVDQPVAIRDLKRLAADQFDPREIEIPRAAERDERVAIIGSGPAGLSAAYQLARKGILSTIFEALPKAGGMLRVGIPDHRLPPEILDREIELITNMGVELKTNAPLGDDLTVDALFEQGFKAVYLAMGAHKGITLGVPGRTGQGGPPGRRFSAGSQPVRQCAGGQARGHRRWRQCGHRRGPFGRSTGCRERSDHLSSHPGGNAGLGRGNPGCGNRRGPSDLPVRPPGDSDHRRRVTGLRCIRMELGEPDSSGRRRPVPVPGSEYDLDIDQLIPAIGQRPDLSAIDTVEDLEFTRWSTTEVDPITYATGRKGVFAGGDLQTGPWVAIGAIAAGKEAAESIERYLDGVDMAAGREPIDRDDPVYRPVPADEPVAVRAKMRELPAEARRGNFNEVEQG